MLQEKIYNDKNGLKENDKQEESDIDDLALGSIETRRLFALKVCPKKLNYETFLL